jgi:ATP-dependent helicase Lhr and Lhr-like helicase
MGIQQSPGYLLVTNWLSQTNRKPFPFQLETWEAILDEKSGLVNAPTGCGKTFAVFLGAVIQYINHNPNDYTKKKNGLQLLWITPLRALAKDIGRAMKETLAALHIPWRVGIRNGDTSVKERSAQKKDIPEILIITPESLHLLLCQRSHLTLFQSLAIIAVDEWHELLGSKRGVQTELAIAYLRFHQQQNQQRELQIWGISATIGNLAEAAEVLLFANKHKPVIIKAGIQKKIQVQSIYPDEIETYSWAGHLGIKLVDKVIPIIQQHTSTLIFINTRGMTESWYQAILQAAPDLAGAIAIHHGSIEQALRMWVEESLHTEKLKAVVCTASLDLGVDFRPVQCVIQVGSPKGVARFLQRAGRSGHQPDATSQIYFLPTHALELLEADAIQSAMEAGIIESKAPLLLCFDVLIQFCCTLAIGDGFFPDELWTILQRSHCYHEMEKEEWKQVLQSITLGGHALSQYDEYKKVQVSPEGLYQIHSRQLAMRHRLHIGTIVSDAMLKVKLISGGFIGFIEEYFISKLEPGDVFTLAGKNLELQAIKDMTVLVKLSHSKKSIVPSWVGGRMPLSAQLGEELRKSLTHANLLWNQKHEKNAKPPGRVRKSAVLGRIHWELEKLMPLLDLQHQLSAIPSEDALLIEHIETKDGYHLFVHTFEGRLVNEAMAAILAYRISNMHPITFSFAMNDYSFELLSDQPIPVDDSNVYELFSPANLLIDIQRSVNATEMAKRKFRDIAVIGGLIFQGMPGAAKKARHLQSSASLLFRVFSDYEPDNLLLRQAYREVMEQQMEEARLRAMLERITAGKIIIQFPKKLTPFSFPVKVDSMRETLSSEKLEDRIKRMLSNNG